MNKTKIAATITLVAMVTNFSASTTSVLAYELSNKDEVTSSTSNKIIQAHQSSSVNGDDDTKESKNNANSLEAEIKKFEKTNGKFEEAYNKVFKVDNSEIASVKSNDGSTTQNLMKAFDDEVETYWASSKLNSDTFKNEIVVTLKESTKIDTMIYGGTPHWQKGYAEQFEIYASNTDEGDDFRLIATGEQPANHDIKEINFTPTKLKRLKFVFKKGNLNQAACSVFWLYKHDDVKETINNLFTDGTMVKLKDEYNSQEAIDALEEKVNKHPLKNQFVDILNVAKELLKEEKDFTDRTFTLTQNGHTHSKSRNVLRMSRLGTDLQSTGIVARPGQVFKIFVEADSNTKLPQIVFTQQEGHFSNWQKEYQLKKGLNVITVPEIYSDSWSQKSVKGGAVYLMNRYTAEEQGKAPVVRIDGGEEFPLYNEGDDKDAFLEKLKAYKEKLDKNPDTTVDIFEFNTKRLLYTGTAKAAYQVYVKEGVDVGESIQVWNDKIQEAFDFAGLKDDPSDPTNDSTNVRTTIRLMQPYGAAYAAYGHVGIQRGIQEIALRTDKDSINSILWGMVHEVGHQMDISEREWGEITNNMFANNAYIKNGAGDRVPYSQIQTSLAPDDASTNFDNLDYSQRLGMFWQLHLKDNTYWAEVEKLYRKRKPSVSNEQAKRDTFAKYASEVLNMNLTEHFEKYGFNLSESCKKELEKYPDGQKTWYLDSRALTYEGNGFEDKDTGLDVSLSKSSSGIRLSMNMPQDKRDDLLGYEIIKNGKVIAFTTSSSYTDTKATNTDEEIQYEVVPYAINLDTGDKVEINSLRPSISIQQEKVTLKLNEEFDAKKYAKAFTNSGENISSELKIDSNVNTSKHGNYEVNYMLEKDGSTIKRRMKVEVVSDYDYLSDFKWESATTVWGTPRRNSNIQGRVNGQTERFEKGFGIHANGKITYDLSDKQYDRFEALLGVDPSAIDPNNNSSVKFKIIADDKTLTSTNVLGYYDNMVYVNVPVSGVKKLVIEVSDAENGNTADHCIIVNPKLTTNNAKPKINAEDKYIKLGQDFDAREGVKAHDQEDGDLTAQIQVESNTFVKDKIGKYEVVYKVADKDGNETTKKINVTVCEDYKVKKSKHGQFANLEEYNKEFKLPIKSVKNNAGNYQSSVITNAIDGKINTHWETDSPNNNSFKNEVTFDLGEVQEISKIAYASRRDGNFKGFATQFEIYVSESESGDDFYLAGQGSYSGAISDVVEFNVSKVKARRVKFKFVQASGDWASFSEVAFYKEDKLSDKMAGLFKNDDKTEVADSYNTLEKLDALREEVKDHKAYELFKVELDKAEKLIRDKFPTLKFEEFTMVKKNSEFNLMDGVVADDKEDGDITNKVVVDNGGFNPNKVGTYTVTYTITDKDSNVTTKQRTIVVYSKSTYLSDMNWESAKTGWRTVTKDTAVGSSDKIKLNVDGKVKTFDKGIGAATNAEIVYNLDGNYNYFTTYLGTDKNYDMDSTTIRFRILADGKEVYTSDVIRKNTPAELVNLDVTGVKKLVLVADDVDGNLVGDFASWADTKVYQYNSKPVIKGDDVVVFDVKEKVDLLQGITATDFEDGDITSRIQIETDYTQGKAGVFEVVYSVTDNDGFTTKFTRKVAITGEETYISDLSWKSATIGSGAIGKDISVRRETIQIRNEDGSYQAYEKGIGTHAQSEIVYDSADYDIFDTWVGLDRYVARESVASVNFKIYVDGVLKAETGIMKADTPKKRLVVDVRGSKQIKLVADQATNGNNWDHADWADAKFRNVPEFNTAELEKLLEEAKELDLNNYTEESIEALENAIQTGEEAMTSENQETVDKAVEQLRNAINSLVEANLNQVVKIQDEYLRKAIQKQLNLSGQITVGDMRKLVSLNLSQVESLEGLQYAINLQSLNIKYNEIRDLSPLKNLKKLTDLKANPIGGLMSTNIRPQNNKATINFDFINREGKKLAPTLITLKNNKTQEVKQLNVGECVDENGLVTIDTEGLAACFYTVMLTYQDRANNCTAQYMFMINNEQ